MKKILLKTAMILGVLALCILAGLTILYFSWKGNHFPAKDKIAPTQLKSYISLKDNKTNRAEYQGKSEKCAGYALAYTFNYFGKNSNGEAVYAEMNKKYNKNKKETGIAEKDIIAYLKEKGYKATWYTGKIENVATRIKSGQVVLALISYSESISHIVPVTGVDKTYVYLAESVVYLDSDQVYNYKMTIANFESKWIDNGTYKKSYIVVEK